MLRPSKIFVSFHQLRHYVQTKISELVVLHQPHHSHPVTQLKNFSTTQQTIVFFSDIQRSLVQKVYLQQSPVKPSLANEKFLLKIIQRHFPVTKVFSAPTLHGRIWATAHSTGQHQFRTMMSSTTTSSGGGFLTWGLPRTASVGVGRNSPAFARQFSTTKSPSCVTLFQNTTNTTVNGQSNIFAHISSRIFSPAGTKINQPDRNEKQSPKFSACPLSLNLPSLEEDCEINDQCYNHLFAAQKDTNNNQSMGELVNQSSISLESETTSALSSSSDCNKRTAKHTTVHQVNNNEKLDSIIRHDDLSSQYTSDGTSIVASAGKRNPSRRRCQSKHGRLKQSLDQHHHVRRMDDQVSSVKHGGIKKKSPSNSTITTTSTIYLLITLDTLQFLDAKENWSTQNLSTSYIDSIELMAYEYQIHINHVLKLLDNLQRHGKFRVVARKSELRIYFPVPPKSKQEAIDFLRAFNIMEPTEKRNCFSIVVEDRQFLISSDDPTSHLAQDDCSSSIGPDYFKDLQMFLDQTDHLIETIPAFASCHRQKD
jgi:hypothetical protein